MAEIHFKWNVNQILETPTLQATCGRRRPTSEGHYVACLCWSFTGDSRWSCHGRRWTVWVMLIHTLSVGCWWGPLSKLAGAVRWGRYAGFIFSIDSMWHFCNLGACVTYDLWALGEPKRNVRILRDLTSIWKLLSVCTYLGNSQNAKALPPPKRKLINDSFYWTPDMCWALVYAVYIYWHS